MSDLLSCPDHRYYKAVQKPRKTKVNPQGCAHCWAIYKYTRVTDGFSISGRTDSYEGSISYEVTNKGMRLSARREAELCYCGAYDDNFTGCNCLKQDVEIATEFSLETLAALGDAARDLLNKQRLAGLA